MICRDGMTALPQHFSFRLARTEDDFRSVFGLRYQVYCRELGWERAVDCLGGFERDAFDGRAQHALLIHHASGEVAACVRVVMPDAHDTKADFPFEALIGRAAFLPPAGMAGTFARRDAFCEISRFAVAADFRRRVGDGDAPLGWPPCGAPVNACDRRSSEPLVVYGLILAATAMFMESGQGFAYALMSTELERLIRQCDLPFARLAGPFEHHGARNLYLISRTDVQRRMGVEALRLLQQVHAQLYGGAGRRPPLAVLEQPTAFPCWDAAGVGRGVEVAS